MQASDVMQVTVMRSKWMSHNDIEVIVSPRSDGVGSLLYLVCFWLRKRRQAGSGSSKSTSCKRAGRIRNKINK